MGIRNLFRFGNEEKSTFYRGCGSFYSPFIKILIKSKIVFYFLLNLFLEFIDTLVFLIFFVIEVSS